MGISLSKKDFSIAGFGIDDVKKALRLVRRRGWSCVAFFARADHLDGDRSTAILLQELLDRDFVEIQESDNRPPRLGLTDHGKSLLAAKGTPRTPIARAESVLEGLLERMAAYNADPENVYFIDEAWLFGSTMRGEASVGDIDLCYTYSRRPPFDTDFKAFLAQVQKQLEARDDLPQKALDQHFWGEYWLLDRALFGARRHPLLSGVKRGTDDIEVLGVPCRRVFDRQRGGRVHDEAIPKHPLSAGRADYLTAPKPLSEAASALRPMDARWVARFAPGYHAEPPQVRSCDLLHERAALFPTVWGSVHFISAPSEIAAKSWKPRLSWADVNGRERCVVLAGDRGAGAAFILNRMITEAGGSVEIRVSLSDFVYQARQIPVAKAGDIARFTSLIVATDAERVLRREIEARTSRTVSISLDPLGSDSRFAREVFETLGRLLDHGFVRTAPEGSTARVDVQVVGPPEMSRSLAI